MKHTMARRASRLVVAVVALLFVVGILGAVREGAATPLEESIPVATYVPPDCPTRFDQYSGRSDSGAPAEGAIPSDFRAVSFRLCFVDEVADHNAETVSDRTGKVTSGLLKALRRSDGHRSWLPFANACSAMLALPPMFFLIDEQGRAIRPRIPRDHCNQPIESVLMRINEAEHQQRTIPLTAPSG